MRSPVLGYLGYFASLTTGDAGLLGASGFVGTVGSADGLGLVTVAGESGPTVGVDVGLELEVGRVTSATCLGIASRKPKTATKISTRPTAAIEAAHSGAIER